MYCFGQFEYVKTLWCFSSFFLLSGSGARNIKGHSVCRPTEAQVRIYLYLFINGTIFLSFVCNSQKCICMNMNSVFHLLEHKSQPSKWNYCWTEYEHRGNMSSLGHNALRYSMHGFLMSHLWRSQFRYTMKRQLACEWPENKSRIHYGCSASVSKMAFCIHVRQKKKWSYSSHRWAAQR